MSQKERKTQQMKPAASYLESIRLIAGVLLLVLGFFGFIGVISSSESDHPTSSPFCLNEPINITADDTGNIYCGSIVNHYIYKFNSSGKLIQNCSVASYGGDFHFIWNSDGYLEFAAARSDQDIFYDSNFNVIRQQVDEDAYDKPMFTNETEYIDKDGNRYEIGRIHFFPYIAKTDHSGKRTVLVTCNPLIWVISNPLSTWVLLVLGLLLVSFNKIKAWYQRTFNDE